MTEYERVREEIKAVLKQIPQDINKYLHNPNAAPTYSDYIDQILSLVEIKSDNQSLPTYRGSPIIEGSSADILIEVFHKAGFVKVIPKPKRK